MDKGNKGPRGNDAGKPRGGDADRARNQRSGQGRPPGRRKPNAGKPSGPGRPPGAGKPDDKGFSRGPGRPQGQRPGRPGGSFKPRGDAAKGPYGKRPQREPAGLKARKIALDVLCDVFLRAAYAQLALNSHLKKAELEPRDTAFVANIVMGSIEHRLQLEYMLKSHLEREVTNKAIWELLVMGAYQIVFMDKVPESAAVNTSVFLAERTAPEFKGLVNAILRRVSENPKLALPEDMPENERMSLDRSMPLWIVDKLIAQYGLETAQRIISAQQPDYIVVRPNALQLRDEAFLDFAKKAGWEIEPGRVRGSFRLRNLPNPAATPEFFKGMFSIEGETAQLAARVTGARPGMQVYDACAAPGGKSMLMAEMMQNTGRVYAMDIHEHRVSLMQGYARRLHLDNVRPGMRDARVLREDIERCMDIVLLDVPCSGLGTFPSKQDIKYRLKPGDIPSLAQVQAEILETCCAYVKPGGVLVYATCTLFAEENEQQVENFLLKHPEFARDALPAEWTRGLPEDFFREEGEISTLPGEVEGFYIARMKRTS